MIRRLLVIVLAASSLAGCNSAPKGAAESASRLIAAALRNDRVAFEAEIDRAAVREDVRLQLAAMARTKALDVDGGPSEFALDRMISPDALRLVDSAGQPLTVAPSPSALQRQMAETDPGHACLKDRTARGECLLTFGRAKVGWRLVGMKATDLRIQVAQR